MIQNQINEHHDFIQHEGQRYSNKIKNTSVKDLKKETLPSCKFQDFFINNEYHQSSPAYMQSIQQNYRFYYCSSVFDTNLNDRKKNKNRKALTVLQTNQLDNNDLFKCNSFKSCSDLYIQNCNDNNSSIDHKINSLLLQLNVNNFQSTFNGILSLIMNDEKLLKTYANTVFKHAILNQPLSFLYSVLSKNIVMVMKQTKHENTLQELLERKCFESFYIPTKATNKWQLTLLHGIVVFTGNLVRVNLIHYDDLKNWEEDLIKNGSKESLILLLNLLYAGGSSLTQNYILIDKLSSKIIESNDSELIEIYNLFIEMTRTDKTDKDQTSPNTDDNHISLFSRSDSVPLNLSSMACKMTMDQMITRYIDNPNFSEFSKLLDDNNFSKNSLKTATELLRSIIKQTEDHLHDLLNLFCDMNIYQYFNESQIKIAFSHVINENKNDEKIGKLMIHIYCRLLIEEIASFNDFETLFAPMNKIWHIIIPFFFCKIDNQLGSWVEEMLDVDFWKNLKFIDSNSIIKQMEILEKWKIIDIFPEYDAIYEYYKLIKYSSNRKHAEISLDEIQMMFDNHKFHEILFEILTSLNDSQMKIEGTKLKRYFSLNPSELEKIANKYGEKGLKLFSFLQK